MASIFKRISDVINANLNDLIDRVEDPERMIKQFILEAPFLSYDQTLTRLIPWRVAPGVACPLQKWRLQPCSWHFANETVQGVRTSGPY